LTSRWQQIAPRIYLDTCVLADATLERGSRNTSESVRSEIPVAKQIFRNWPKENLFISPFVIGELIELGKRYDKTEDEMVEVVTGQVLPRCTVIYAEETELASIARLYSAVGVESNFAFNVDFKGEATDEKGILHNDAHRNHIVLFNGQFADSIFEGLPEDAEILRGNAVLRKTEVERVSAPVFELALFHRLAHIVHETNIPWKDAFHLYYARKENCFRILTNDGKMIRKLKNIPNGLGKPVSPSQFKKEMSAWGWGSTEFFSEMFETKDG
jgi:rRNA-processing protein FCF1